MLNLSRTHRRELYRCRAATRGCQVCPGLWRCGRLDTLHVEGRDRRRRCLRRTLRHDSIGRRWRSDGKVTVIRETRGDDHRCDQQRRDTSIGFSSRRRSFRRGASRVLRGRVMGRPIARAEGRIAPLAGAIDAPIRVETRRERVRMMDAFDIQRVELHRVRRRRRCRRHARPGIVRREERLAAFGIARRDERRARLGIVRRVERRATLVAVRYRCVGDRLAPRARLEMQRRSAFVAELRAGRIGICAEMTGRRGHAKAGASETRIGVRFGRRHGRCGSLGAARGRGRSQGQASRHGTRSRSLPRLSRASSTRCAVAASGNWNSRSTQTRSVPPITAPKRSCARARISVASRM